MSGEGKKTHTNFCDHCDDAYNFSQREMKPWQAIDQSVNYIYLLYLMIYNFTATASYYELYYFEMLLEKHKNIVCIKIVFFTDPANAKHLYNICTTSALRLRRWPNVFDVCQTLYKCYTNVLC